MTPLDALRICTAWDALMDSNGEFTTDRDRTLVDAAELVLAPLTEADLDVLIKQMDREGVTPTIVRPEQAPVCENEGTVSRDGIYTKLVNVECRNGASFVALIKPDQDRDEYFKCFDIDNNEWLRVRGWLADVSDYVED